MKVLEESSEDPLEVWKRVLIAIDEELSYIEGNSTPGNVTLEYLSRIERSKQVRKMLIDAVGYAIDHQQPDVIMQINKLMDRLNRIVFE